MTDYPMVQARWFTAGRTRTPRLIVVHSTESLERAGTARNVARYFATTDRKASAHLVVDPAEIIRCVRDKDTAYAAKGANADGLHVELCGKAAQTAIDWDDAASRSILGRAAHPVALWCREYDIPPVFIGPSDVKGGARGITTHAVISAAYPSTGHSDPGPYFPMNKFLEHVRKEMAPPEVNDMGSPRIAIDQLKDGRTIVAFEDGGVWLSRAGDPNGPTEASRHSAGDFQITRDVAEKNTVVEDIVATPEGGVLFLLKSGHVIARDANDPGDAT